MTLEKLSRHIALKIKQYDPDGPGSVEVLEYGIGLKLNLYAGILLTVLFGVLFSDVLSALLALGAFIALRKFSGGVHLPITVCSIVTGLGAAILPLIGVDGNMRLILDTATIAALLAFAPHHFEVVYRAREENVMLAKLTAIGLVLLNLLWIQSSIISMAFAIQAVLILPIFPKKGGVPS
ncbi:accessory gene regulator B family protein [Paenibacillus sp. NFR01]|uniref:accessory gene regulator B family protein n=1 Tax=Paenibacillus sp. NFR01 TaxID=1566279 RepID=UPI0008C4EFFF|nr:accessory gene regulator B family protein [Paenibacillus sp. NFR01]SET49103.1 accessory gene regulator B [Paenibacillus sp. NFR01]